VGVGAAHVEGLQQPLVQQPAHAEQVVRHQALGLVHGRRGGYRGLGHGGCRRGGVALRSGRLGVLGALPVHAQRVRTDVQRVVLGHRRGVGHAAVVQQRAEGGVEVAHEHALVGDEQLGMPAADLPAAQHDVAVVAAADDAARALVGMQRRLLAGEVLDLDGQHGQFSRGTKVDGFAF
jgi:hypothetical protein